MGKLITVQDSWPKGLSHKSIHIHRQCIDTFVMGASATAMGGTRGLCIDCASAMTPFLYPAVHGNTAACGPCDVRREREQTAGVMRYE